VRAADLYCGADDSGRIASVHRAKLSLNVIVPDERSPFHALTLSGSRIIHAV